MADDVTDSAQGEVHVEGARFEDWLRAQAKRCVGRPNVPFPQMMPATMIRLAELVTVNRKLLDVAATGTGERAADWVAFGRAMSDVRIALAALDEEARR